MKLHAYPAARPGRNPVVSLKGLPNEDSELAVRDLRALAAALLVIAHDLEGATVAPVEAVLGARVLGLAKCYDSDVAYRDYLDGAYP